MSLEMAHKVIVPQKKIMSRSFLNSGTLTVIMSDPVRNLPRILGHPEIPEVFPRPKKDSRLMAEISH
jgi:hypothetical protein